ncbi:MAG: lolA [Cellvibrio sp.]|jgi:outer membrane lipoprotein carrier protein|nr:lolA [Cellvibrio sp.]
MKFLSSLFACLSLVLSFAIHAADDQAAAQLRKQLDAMNSLQGDFVQTTYDKKGVEQETSSGNFMLMRPGKFYWKTLEPMQQLLVSNNKTIWLYDPDLETVNERAFTDDLRETPALLLSADIEQLRKSFTVTRDEKEKTVEKYTLTPKVTEGMFQHLTLVFNANQLTEFAIQDSLGQLTRCVLTNVQRNKTLPEEKFFFIPPEGVEILKD